MWKTSDFVVLIYYDNKSQLPHSGLPSTSSQDEQGSVGGGDSGRNHFHPGVGLTNTMKQGQGRNNIGGIHPKNIWRYMLLAMSLRCTHRPGNAKHLTELRALNPLITPPWGSTMEWHLKAS